MLLQAFREASRLSRVHVLAICTRYCSATTSCSCQKMEGSPSNLGPGPFVELKEYSYRENLAAMQSVRFLRPCCEGDQHLDVGCGPGNFIQEHLLPHLRPCRRVVGVDSSWEMLDYARRHCREPEVAFEHLDIERGEPQAIIDKYGQFDRVYSFLTFHYVWDLERAYHNVSTLLKGDGECLVACFVRTGITDMWHKVFSKQQWRPYMPDLSGMLSDRFSYNAPVPWEELKQRERSAATAAGLDVVACHIYSSQWVFPTAEACLGSYIPFFKLDENIPRTKREEFWEDCRIALLETSPMTADGISQPYNVLVAHSRKAPSVP
ncbi:juvenile hormone acid O-methyltransferase-like [Haemaphysalis longicornis]